MGIETRVSKREWVIAGGIAFLLTLGLSLPYLLGYFTARAGTMYTGLLVNVEDANYITIIQRGSEGAWLHSLRFTSEPDTLVFLYAFYLAWGHLAGLMRIDATTMWHIARIVMTLVTGFVTYGFVAHFIQSKTWRMVAYLLAILGAGFDWFAFPWETLTPTSATPVDLKMADAHLFSAALTFPHYLASISLFMVLFWSVTRQFTEPLAQKKYALLLAVAVLANIGIAIVYPFFAALSLSVVFVYAVSAMVRARWFLVRETAVFALIAISVLPLLIYYAIALGSNENLRVWAWQSQTLSPSPLHYLLAFAPYLILGAWDGWRLGLGAERYKSRRLMLWAWLFTVIVLLYAPLGAQRRFLQGVQVPLAILGTSGLCEVVLPSIQQTSWFEKLSKRPGYSVSGLSQLLVIFLILIVSLSSVYQWVSAIFLATVEQPYPLFRPRAEVEAMDWLRAHAKPADVVLAAYYTGSYLPLRSGTRTYIGHLYETIHFQDKERASETFFDSQTGDAERIGFLRSNDIAYVFYGRKERELGRFDPMTVPYLQAVEQTSDAVVYRVVIP